MLLRSFFAGITRFSLRFKWVTIGLTVAFLVLGVVGAVQLNQELFPAFDLPQTYVFTLRPGASAEDLRDLITIPLENELTTIKNVVPAGIESTTASSIAVVSARSEFGVDMVAVREQVNRAIDKVVNNGVPLGLKTTADLTPDIIRKVLTQAPSMWKHFESDQLLAMPPEVLDAALVVNPDFVNQIDVLTRDQLAAERVSQALTGTQTSHQPVKLPGAWALTKDSGQPKVYTFGLGDIPVISASISSKSPDMTADQLRDFVQKNIVDKLKGGEIEGIANVSLSGGEQIPADVSEAAAKAVANGKNGSGSTNTDPSGSAAVESTPAPTALPQQANPVPALAESWRVIRVLTLTTPSPLPDKLKSQFQTTAVFNTADDLLNATDASGSKLTAAKLLSQVAEINPALLREHLPAEVLAYLRGKEPDFGANLSDTALEALAMAVLKQTTWAQLVNQAGFQKAGIQSLLDLNKLNGGSVAGTLNVLVDLKTPPALDSFKVRIIDGLTPEAVLYLTKQEPGFLTALKPEVLRAMSAITLKSLPESFWSSLADATLKSDLTAIADGSKPSAATTLNGSDGGASTMTDDPNAPQLPDNWKQAPGMNLKTAQDFLKKPYGLSAGAFLNAAGASPQGGAALLSTLGPEVLLYIQAHDPTFFDTLDVATLNMLTKETLQKLPQSVQDRVSGPVFVPKETVTRADGQNSQILTVNKASDANTVKVYHGILDLFDRVRAANPEIQISVILEMSSFIEESIAGVAREGGLGAIMAVIVILLFLNFSVRSTIVTAVSIPTSVAMAFMLMRWVPGNVHTFLMQPGIISALPESIHNFLLALFPASITLNIMTLSGLTVAIGRVMDDSIVVLENIYRQLQKGTPRREAIIKGTRDVSLAIFAATTTTIIVFLPIGLTGGIVGQVFLPFGMAVTYALASSFVVAITLVPLLAYLFVDPKTLPEEKEGQLGKSYHGLLTWSLNHRAAVLLIAVVSLVIGLIIFAQRPTTFIPPLGDPRIAVNVSMPSGTSLAQTDARVREFEKYIESQKSNGVARYQVTVGSGGGYEDIMAALGGSKTINGAAASITVAVDVSGDALIALTQDVRAKANALFGEKNVKVSKATISEQGFGGFALVLSGPEATLRQLNDKVIKTLSGVPGMTNVSSSLSQVGDATSYLRVNRTAAISYGAELEVNDTLGATSKAIEAVKAIPDLPSDVKISQGFTSEIQTQGFSQTFSAMGIAVVAVYVVMVLTFGSLVHPFTILFSLPLAVVGAAVGLWVTNRVVGISALVGLLMLIGIVVTNAIVMIDRVQQNRREKHLAPREALVEGARTRLRPILMTAIATMFALLPLAIGVSQGAIIASELGTVVIGGLFSSTILTLLVVPVVFSMVDALQRRLTGKKVKEPGVAEA